MSRVRIGAKELSRTMTCITHFMLDSSGNKKMYFDLYEIFEKDYQRMEKDPSNDLKILQFTSDMANGKWTKDIDILIRDGEAIDSIHRGVAYLRCVYLEKILESKLPCIYHFTVR